MCSCTKDSRHSDRIISLIQKRGAASRFHRTCTVVHADISRVFHLPTPLLVQSLRLLQLTCFTLRTHGQTLKCVCICLSGSNYFIPPSSNSEPHSDSQSHITRQSKMSAPSPVEGASAPLCRLLSSTVFSVCREKVGQILRYFAKTPFQDVLSAFYSYIPVAQRKPQITGIMQVPSTSST